MNTYKISYGGHDYLISSDTYMNAKKELAKQLDITWDCSKKDTQHILMASIRQQIDGNWAFVKE